VGRDYQAASNSQADGGTLKGGPRRRRAHHLRSLQGTEDLAMHTRPRASTPWQLAMLPIRIVRTAVALALPVVIVAGLVLVRGGALDHRPAADATFVGANLTPAARLAGGATALETALGKGGDGLRFEVVQNQTLRARPGGKRIEIPHPTDRFKTIGLADEYFLSSLASRGIATAGGFWSELRAGPVPGEDPDWTSDLLFSALEADGVTWRDDGRGWYKSDSPPGIGLDPVSVRLLPDLLRNVTGAADAAPQALEGATLAGLTATAAVKDLPGVIAADGKAFTKLRGPVTMGFDAGGRLATLSVSALNTNLTDFDLVVDTTIVIHYGDTGDLPDAKPAYDPKAVQR
jgi:hypothetical protein